MKIGITCYPTYGGSGVVATELGMELAARGHEVHFISYAPPFRLDTSNDHIQFHEVEVATYPLFDHPPYALALAVKMGEVAESAQLDLLHVHYAIPHSVSALLARSMAASRKATLPFITTLHGTDITLVGADRSYLPITRFSIEQSDGVTTISTYLKERTQREFDIKRPIEVIPNFVNCDVYRRHDMPELRAEWAPDGEPILMHLSNFRPVKRVTDVVEIFAMVREKMRAKLVLIGDGPDRGAAEWLVRQKGLACDVHFLGKQDRVYDKLSQADLFLLPSDLESFGLAALEAMACEVPVIATRVGGLPEVVKHGADGYLVQPRDVVTAGRHAIEILSRSDRGREMGKKARENATWEFCASKIIPLYEGYYSRVLAEVKSPRS
ncbi:MAG: N-acetyl-alpha-D-glucosaminyl L-malate synthase BshA [Acidobacteria bacterium]|nr:N-acetyl-alpha-D-glucosaminyl L-malate synthase BshA [Acidobacteriota bacterium]MCL5286830.1 N-acetyl-alpha-D-glucosaminyl L-malate synthase BshA [Acidobacteriota bacterium]